MIVGYEVSVVEVEFGGMFNVLCYGVLFYGGFVLGVDWIVMLFVGEENLCEVILFLMN